ncbi:hypothetical protein V8E54_005115 [Elaphomyces granulatus]
MAGVVSSHDLEIAYLFGDEGHLEYLFGDREIDSLDRYLAQFSILDTTAAVFVFAALCLLAIMVGKMRIILHCVHSVLCFLACTHSALLP